MRSIRLLALITAAVAFGASHLGAQMPGPGSNRPVSLVVSGGLTVPAGDLADLHDSGFHYDVSLLVNFAGMPLTLRPELSLSRLKLKDAVGGGYGGGDVTQMVAALGNIEFPLAGGLYLLAGGGVLSLSLPDAATAGAGESATKFTFDAGAGLRFRMGGIRGFVEARIGAASYEEGKFGFSQAQFIPVSFGLVF